MARDKQVNGVFIIDRAENRYKAVLSRLQILRMKTRLDRQRKARQDAEAVYAAEIEKLEKDYREKTGIFEYYESQLQQQQRDLQTQENAIQTQTAEKTAQENEIQRQQNSLTELKNTRDRISEEVQNTYIRETNAVFTWVQTAYMSPVVRLQEEEVNEGEAADAPNADANAPEGAANAQRNSCIFRKRDLDDLNAIRTEAATRSTWYGATKNHSRQFMEMQESIRNFYNLFEDGDALHNVTDVNRRLARLTALERALQEIEDRCDAYTSKGWSRWLFAGKARARHARQAKASAMEKRAEIHALIETLTQNRTEVDNRFRDDMNAARQRADESLRQRTDDVTQQITETQNKIAEAQNKMAAAEQLISNAQQKAADLRTSISDTEKLRDDQLRKSKEKVIKDQTQKELKKARLEQNAEAQKELEDFHRDVLARSLADRLFDPEHNPVPDYTDDFREAEGLESMTFNHPGEIPGGELLKMADLAVALHKKAGISYSPDALITLANLQLIDKIMDVDRGVLDYYAEVEYLDPSGASISAQKFREQLAAFKEGSRPCRCIVKNIRAGRLSRENRLNPKDDIRLGERELVEMGAATALLNTDTPELKSLLPEDIKQNNPDLINSVMKRVDQMKDIIHDCTVQDAAEGKIKSPINFTTVQSLTYRLATKTLDYTENADLLPLKGSPVYYSDKAISNLYKMNVKGMTRSSKIPEIESSMKHEFFSPGSLRIADPALISEGLKNLLSSSPADPVLQRILQQIREAAALSEKDVFNYKTRYVTVDQSGYKVPKGTEYTAYRETVSAYDQAANALHRNILTYTRLHAGDLAVKTSPAFLLNEWRKKVFLEADKEPWVRTRLDININTASSYEPEDPLQPNLSDFDGDHAYMLTAPIMMCETKYYAALVPAPGEKKPDTANAPDGKKPDGTAVPGGKKPDGTAAQDPKKEPEKEPLSPLAQKLEYPEYYLRDVSDEPLFTKEPEISDIHQGSEGNCFFLAGMTAYLRANPGKIRDLIFDNGDGTVTCKFLTKKGSVLQPWFVTVSKKIAAVRFGQDKNLDPLIDTVIETERVPLWLKLYQKAYMLSGIAPAAGAADHTPELLKKIRKLNPELKDKPDVQILRPLIKARCPKIPEAEIDGLPDAEVIERGKFLANNSMAVADGGRPEQVLSLATGENFIYQPMAHSTPESILAILSDLDTQAAEISSCDPMSLPANDRMILHLLGKSAAQQLVMENVTYGKDSKGHDIYSVRTISLEDVTGALQHAAENLSESQLRKYKQDDVDRVAKMICTKITEYQMSCKDPTKGMLFSEVPGNYSEYAQEIYRTISENVRDKKSLTCAFYEKETISLLDKKLDKDDLEISSHQKNVRAKGAVSHHAFTILGCREVDGIRKIILRNPWGHQDRIHQEAVLRNGEKLPFFSLNSNPYYSSGSGIFEMELSDFCALAHDIVLKETLHPTAQVQKNVASRMVDVYREKEPEKYRKLTETMTEEQILEKAEKSDTTRRYGLKVIRLEELQAKAQNHEELSGAEKKEADSLRRQLKDIVQPAGAEKTPVQTGNAKVKKQDTPAQAGMAKS